MNDDTRRPGPIALAGSGEFLSVMEDADRALLDRVGGAARARVVVLPTASGLEDPGSPAHWARLGIDHFTRLGAQVEAAIILDRSMADDPRWLPALEAADFYYFSGGNPRHLIDTMAGSQSWATIQRRHMEGAVLAGCSAGAMAICGITMGFRALRDQGTPEWEPALGVLPRLVVAPHFDRMAGFVGEGVLQRLVRAVPAGVTLIGVDEETVLVRQDILDSDGLSRWQVAGRQTVSVFEGPDTGPLVYHAGDTVQLISGRYDQAPST